MSLAMLSAAKTNGAAKATARVGRPPSVNAQAIITAAIEIGLERFTLKQVADRLGVAVATLYRHVSNRDELVRLAAFRLALTRRLPGGGDRHWSDVATAYAESLFDSFVSEPQLVHELVKGRFGPDVELDFLEQFLAELGTQGFTPVEAIRLHHAVAMLAIGAAVGAIANTAGRSVQPSHEAAMKRALAERGDHELPCVRSAMHEYLRADPRLWLDGLRELLAGMAAARGETLPAARPSLNITAGAGAPTLLRPSKASPGQGSGQTPT